MAGTPKEQAAEIRAAANANNVRLSAHGGIVTVSTTFTPGDKAAYVAAENACNNVLRLVRQTRPGSVWGNDSASVGGAIGLAGGYCRLNISGVDKRVAKILAN